MNQLSEYEESLKHYRDLKGAMDTSLDQVMTVHIAGMTPIFEDSLGDFRQLCQLELDIKLRLKVIDTANNPETISSIHNPDTSMLLRRLPSSIQTVIDDVLGIEDTMNGHSCLLNN